MLLHPSIQLPSLYIYNLFLPLTQPTRRVARCSVIKIILQFCKENGLAESFNAIQVTALLLRDVMCVLLLLLLLLLCR